MTTVGRITRAVSFFLLLAPAALSALQIPPENGNQDQLASGFAVFSANALAGGVTAGVRALLEGKDIARAFGRGALGGALNYAGKRIAVIDWQAAPVTGRTIAALGNAIVVQAAEPGSLLDSARIPVGPLRFGFSRQRGLRPSISVVLVDVVSLIEALTTSDLHVDWKRSLYAATPVFLVRPSRLANDDVRIAGQAHGNIVLLDGVSPGEAERVFPHELTHVLQHDFTEATWDLPVERWVRRQVPGARLVPAWLSIAVLVPSLIGLDDVLNDDNGVLRRFKEAEAEWFEHR